MTKNEAREGRDDRLREELAASWVMAAVPTLAVRPFRRTLGDQFWDKARAPMTRVARMKEIKIAHLVAAETQSRRMPTEACVSRLSAAALLWAKSFGTLFTRLGERARMPFPIFPASATARAPRRPRAARNRIAPATRTR
jgi:hypothetical protein